MPAIMGGKPNPTLVSYLALTLSLFALLSNWKSNVNSPFTAPNSLTDSSNGAVGKPGADAVALVKAANKLSWIRTIRFHERKIFSQNGEDGIIEVIFDTIGTTDKFYVEFGVQSGVECNTRLLFERYGWNGVLMDGDGKANDGRVIYNHFITAENIVSLFEEHKVPKTFDLLSVDLDRNDFYITRNILKAGYRPRVFIGEINRSFGPKDPLTVVYEANSQWKGDSYFGISVYGLSMLLDAHDYQFVYADQAGVNVFFVHRPVLAEYVSKQIGTVVTWDQIKDVAPSFMDVYFRQESIHAHGGFPDFIQNTMSKPWMRISPDGSVVENKDPFKQQLTVA